MKTAQFITTGMIMLTANACGQRADLHTQVSTNKYVRDANTGMPVQQSPAAEEVGPSAEQSLEATLPAAVTNPAAQPSAPAAPAPQPVVDNNKPSANPTPQPVVKDDASSWIAVPPVIVGGAFLKCGDTLKADTIACQLQNANGESMTVPQNLTLNWSIINPVAQNLVATTATRYDTEAGGTYFFVAKKGTTKPIVELRADLNNSQDRFRFNSRNLDNDPVLRLVGVPILETPNLPMIGALPLPQEGFGDGATEGDNCSFKGTPKATGREPLSLSGTLATQETVGLYVHGICGLQSRGVIIRIEAADGAPFRPIEVTLVPNAGHVMAFEKLVMPAGTYKYSMWNSVVDANGGVDDYIISEVRLLRN